MYLSKKAVALLAGVMLLIAAPFVYGAPGEDDGNSGGNKSRWALVDETGTIVSQSGGFTAVDCYKTNANCYLDIGSDATVEGLGATIADQNSLGTGQGASLTGEIGVGACGIPQLTCAPPGTDQANIIVVTPRNSDGSTTTATPPTRKRFYVEVVGPNA